MSRKEEDNPVQQAFADLLLVTGAGDKLDCSSGWDVCLGRRKTIQYSRRSLTCY